MKGAALSGLAQRERLWILAFLLVLASAAVLTVPVLSHAAAGDTERVSVASDGSQVTGENKAPVVSADGRYVVFFSYAADLVADDTNGVTDVFIHDRETDATERVSVANDGGQAAGASSDPAVSANGRYVTFHSYATTLVAGDTNNAADVFVRDREMSTTERVSVTSTGTQTAAGDSLYPAISANGRYVVFHSFAEDLVPDDDNGLRDVFIHDRDTGTTERVSVANDGSQATGLSVAVDVSADGRRVAFHSYAENLVADDSNGAIDVFVRDLDASTTVRASVASDGGQSAAKSEYPGISADGRYVTFRSEGTTLVPGDTNGFRDVFIHDLMTGNTELVSISSTGTQGFEKSGAPSPSSDGRYVAFRSKAATLVAGDTNGAHDIFVRDRQANTTVRVSVASDGTEGNDQSGSPTISDDGRYVSFGSLATTLVAGDTNGERDIFVHDYTGDTTPPALEIVRRGGRDRYAVAVDASRSNFDSSDQVILATGWTYADALSASGLAGCLDAPILVTLQDRLPANVEAEIVRLGASKVTIVGGPYSVQPSIEAHLRDDLGLVVERIGGPDRYAVSEAIAARVRGFGTDQGRVFIASGEVGADALSLSPVVYQATAPLVLTRRDSVPAAARRALGAGTTSKAVLAGGPVTVTEATLSTMEGIVGTDIERLWGADRYGTAGAVARYGTSSGISSYAYLGVANGADEKFADSLCGGPAVGVHGGVMTLTQADVLPSSTRAVITDAKGTVVQVQVFGGPRSVSEGVIDQIRLILE